MRALLLGVFILTIGACAAGEWGITHFITGCRVQPLRDGESLVAPGDFCLFDPDGTIYSASGEGLRAFRKDGAVAWNLKGHFHHHLSFNVDRTLLLALETRAMTTTPKMAEDVFVIVSKADGKIQHELRSSQLLSMAKVSPVDYVVTTPLLRERGLEKEISHFNSFYEIPPLAPKAKVPAWLRTGSFVLNSVGLGFFVVSPDLGQLRFHGRLPGTSLHRVHDLQVLDDGGLLFFNNLVAKSPVDAKYSAVDRVDPTSFKLLERFEVQPKSAFYSNIGGTVQVLDRDHWLIGHFLTGFHIYSRARRTVVFSRSYYESSRQPDVVLQLRAEDLTSFFSSRR